MKIFFRKHGNSLFYVFLPILFLGVTLAFIQFTPKSSRTAVLDSCTDPDECCTSSGCGVDTGETCINGTCERTNVGCVEGEVDDQGEGDCVCVNDAGTVVGECVVCALDENFIGGFCVRLCGPDEDPEETGCIQVEGSGDVISCAFNPLPVGTIPWMSLGVAGAYLLGLVGLRIRRK